MRLTAWPTFCPDLFARLPAILLVLGMLPSAYSKETPPAEPSGASLAFTSTQPAVVHARQLVEQGKLAEAESFLTSSGGSSQAAVEMREIIRRVRIDYSLSAEELLAKLKPSISDVTPNDLERWRKSGGVQYRMIDGHVAYFTREPSNIFRFCGEAKERRGDVPEPAGWTLEKHLARVIAEARRTSRTQVVPMHHRVTYTLTILPNAPGIKKGALVRVWLPFPQEYRQQGEVKLIRTSPEFKSLAPSATGEYPLAGAPQRTLYFEQTISDPSQPLKFEEVFEFTSSAWYPVLDDDKARPLPSDYAHGNLGERLPHIAFTPELRQTVAGIIGSETNPLIKARKIFHFIDQNIAYNAEQEYCIIPSLSTKALTSRRGDCGVQTMLFITMCRCAGVPARWQTGWETKRIGWNMHDWAEFYVEPWGWLPADPSYGLRKSDDPKVREFYFGHQDSYRMIVNRDYGSPLQPPRQSLRSEPLDFQRGEVEIDGKNLYFPDWNYDVKFEWLDEE